MPNKKPQTNYYGQQRSTNDDTLHLQTYVHVVVVTGEHAHDKTGQSPVHTRTPHGSTVVLDTQLHEIGLASAEVEPPVVKDKRIANVKPDAMKNFMRAFHARISCAHFMLLRDESQATRSFSPSKM